MKSWFRVRGYPDDLVKDEIGKVCFSKSTGSKSKSQESKVGLSWCFTYRYIYFLSLIVYLFIYFLIVAVILVVNFFAVTVIIITNY